MPRRLAKTESARNQDNAPDFSSSPLPKEPAFKKPKNIQLKKQLADIYSEIKKDPSITPPPEKNNAGKIFFWFLLITIFLTGVSWAGLYFLGQGPNFSEENIQLQVIGPEKITSGDIIKYVINYKNAGRLPLGNTSLSVHYPEGFTFVSANPAPSGSNNQNWDIGALDTNKDGSIEITGQIFGAAEKDLTLRTFFNYRPANFNAAFQKITNFTGHITSVPIELSIAGPDEINAGANALFSITAFNSGIQDLSNLEMELTLPNGFKVTSSTPKATAEGLVWKIPSLAAKTTSTLGLNITAASNMLPGDQVIKVIMNSRQNNQIFAQNSLEKHVQITKADLVLQVAANGVTDKQAVNFGDKINLAVNYENTGNTTLKNVTLRLILDAPALGNKSLLDWSTIEDKANGDITGEQTLPQIRRGIVTWTKAQIPALKEIKPKDKGTIELILPIKSKASLDLTKLTESKTTLYAEALINTEQNTYGDLQSNNINLILNSDLNISIQATYKESKNLPIAIGKKYDTKSIYGVTWTVTNSLHELTDLQLTAALPENVDWGKNFSVSAGDITYDENTKQISWKLNRLPTSVNKVIINFDVGVKSAESDKGQGAVLVEKIRVEAKDKITDENVLLFKDPILTVL